MKTPRLVIQGLLCKTGTEIYCQRSSPNTRRKLSPLKGKGVNPGSVHGKRQASPPKGTSYSKVVDHPKDLDYSDLTWSRKEGWAEELLAFDTRTTVLRGDFEKHVVETQQRKQQRQKRKVEKLREFRSTQNIWRRKHDVWVSQKSVASTSMCEASIDSLGPATESLGTCGLPSLCNPLNSQDDDLELARSGTKDQVVHGERRRSREDSSNTADSPADLAALLAWADDSSRPPSIDHGSALAAKEVGNSEPIGRKRTPNGTKSATHEGESGKSPALEIATAFRRISKEKYQYTAFGGDILSDEVQYDSFNHPHQVDYDPEHFVFQSVVDHGFRFVPDRTHHEVEELDEVEQKVVDICKREGLDVFEVDHMRRVFHKADSDRSGCIGESEFSQLIRGIMHCHDQYDIPENRLRYFWNLIDGDKNGRIDFVEFVSWWSRYSDLISGRGNSLEDEY